VQIDLEGWRIGLRYDADASLVGDSRICLKALLPLLTYKTKRSYLDDFREQKREWDELMKERGTRMDKPMKPQVVAWELGKRLTDNAIISCDTGTITTWWARQIYARRGQMFMCSGNLATMAPGLPYTIAAQIAFPNRQCVAFVGDGGFSMLMADFVTAVKYKLPIKVVLIKNNVLGQIKWEQMVMLGNPEYVVELEPMDFAGIARNMGGAGYTIEDPADCGKVLDEALSNDKPTLIEAVVDPNEPPLPGKIKPEQALHFAESLMRGQPASRKIVETILGDKYREVI
jgi:pyruvate dehydrogenase (quinone)/pyruvate oxidase